MNDSTITLKTVGDLRLDTSGQPQRYWIASYQRGYRWSSLQVRQLLEDIRDFTRRRNPQPDDFYCLQPLVLKQIEGRGYEVVDGQQRLTTLLLILRHFNERLAAKFQQKIFTLDYATRPNLVEFLDNPTEPVANSNVDFFHLFEAVKTIEQWFGEREDEVNAISSALLTQTKVIWFQLAEGDNAVEAFTRLNVGKIPLTNDELIRALFLRRTNANAKQAAALQLNIAHEWDQLEKSLQSDPFWYFLSNRPTPGQNRISFIFEIVAKAEGIPPEYERDANAIFYAYSKKLNDDGARPETEWLKIKQAFMTLEEWFEDRNLFHVVGFLIQQGAEVGEIRKLAEGCSKKVFARKLRQEVWTKVFDLSDPETLDSNQICDKIADTLDDLEYGRHSPKIRSILLLFNLATLLQSERSNIRFQFDSFKREKWDIEHVRSVASDRPERYDARRDWLKHCLGYLEHNLQDDHESLKGRLETFIALPQNRADDATFEQLYNELLEVFQETMDDDADNGVANLTLLDSKTNRSYKNAVFAVKRKRLLELDQSGIFVPLCTRNVFLKCYSPQVDNAMFWGEDDRESYRKVLVETLSDFFQDKQGSQL